MRKMVLTAAIVWLVLFMAVRVEAQKQRIPITISWTELNPNGTFRVGTTNLLSTNGSQMVAVIDLKNNTFDIEEWDASLSNRVDRRPAAAGVQPWLVASYLMSVVPNATSNVLTFAADLETGDPVDVDWDDNGAPDHLASISIIGTMSFKPTGLLTNRNGTSVLTGVVTRINAQLQGVLNDPVALSNGVHRILRRGQLRSGRAPAFYVDELE
ncbi:MAG: hypothetical protein NZ483_06285 [Verrucomicrobiae bacterium]|nr:hypothetical protein [Verrucomicrobiae bacterium]MDW8345264.1 hypothetical protein [Verrucomicrobiae bacterium]